VGSVAPQHLVAGLGARRPRLAVIEDDDDLRDLLRLVMAPAGWDVSMAPSAGLGTMVIDTFDPDVVVLDLGLPDASGLDVLETLQSDPATAWIPVVVLSGDRDPASATAALLSGAQDFIAKPFVPDELQARLTAALRVASAHRALAGAEQRFRLTFEEAPIGIALVSLEGKWQRVNRAMADILGRSAEELLGTTFQEVTHPDDLDADVALVGRLLSGEIERYRMEKRYLHPDGHVVWTELSVSLVRDDDGVPRHFVSHVQDITTLHEARELLIHQSLHDPLTGLANRALLFDRLRQALAHEERHHRGLAVLFLDLDQLKAVNDQHGHDAGDDLLVQISHRLAHAVREGDTIARLGGDEFVVVAESIGGTDGALELAERVRSALAEPYEVVGVEVGCTASIGVTVPRRGQQPEEILREADRAMYRAKELGKDRWVLVDESLWVRDGARRAASDRTW
jgi:diguanylate cyclase (GGDEF)-like protein/PAS domain S-box-containing protein